MALTPRITGTNLIPSGSGRFAVSGAVAPVDPTPLTEINQMNALIYEGQSEFQYDNLDPRQLQQETPKQQRQQYTGRQTFDRFGRPFEQTPERRIDNPMLSNSSESFASAFDIGKDAPQRLSGEPPVYQPVTSLDNIITTYETTAQVIYDEIPPRGDSLSLIL